MKSELEGNKNQLHLIVQYYHCASPERQAEIDTCLRNNLLNPHLTAVHLLTEEQFDLSQYPNNEKIKQSVVGKRLTYKGAFEYASSFNDDIIWLLSNADIYFDDSLQLLQNVTLQNVIYALSRHDVLSDGSIKFIDEGYAHGSQDVWIFKAPLKLADMFTDFNLGVPGCDNRIAYEIMKADYILVNPGKVIKCYHLDLTKETDIDKRTADYITMHTTDNVAEGKIAPPPYQFYIFPSNVIGLEHIDVYREMSKKMLDLTTVNNNLIDCHDSIEELARRIALLNNQLNERDSMIIEQNSVIIQRDAMIIERDATITSILNSKSWKITAPLRKLLNIFK